MKKKPVTGKTLISMGFKPGRWFKSAIDHINENSLEGEEMSEYIESILPKPKILPFDRPVFYHKNISGQTDEEISNIESVFSTMDEVMKTPTVLTGAVMPDSCPAGSLGQIPVGGVVVTHNAIHPAMHSADVCCSVMISNIGKVDCKKVLDAAMSVTHFGPGGRSEFSRLPEDLNDKISGNAFLSNKKSIDLSRYHMGTQGDGNHFLFVGTLESTGETAIVTHHGSRGFGAALYSAGMKTAEKFRANISPKTLKKNAWIPFETEEGKNYWDALQIVREWTKLNHETIHDAVIQKLGLSKKDRFWNEHNFVFKDGDKFYHAKGSTPLLDKFVPDSTSGLRLIPLNMSQPVLIVRGVENDNNIGFAPHGAGRNMSRTSHKKTLACETELETFERETKEIDARFFSGEIDTSELPSAYKDADTVQKQMKQFGLGEVVDRVIPYGCIMAGDWQKNAPWRKNNNK